MITELGVQARLASRLLARADSGKKNEFLLRLAENLKGSSNDILAANQADIKSGERSGLAPALLDRLSLNKDRLSAMAEDLRVVAELPDPVGEIFDKAILPNGLQVHKQRVPLGVLAVVYESRPNVTVDVAGLA
jgi:glutamate-5-semialdehyde dehydrogenase